MRSISAGPNSANTAETASAKPKPHSTTSRVAVEKVVSVPRAIGIAAELLGGIGESIQEECVDQQEIVQHRIGGKRHVAGARPLRGEEQKRRNQRGGCGS